MRLYDFNSSGNKRYCYLWERSCRRYVVRRVAGVIVCTVYFIMFTVAAFIFTQAELGAEQEGPKAKYADVEEVDAGKKMKDEEYQKSIRDGRRSAAFDLVLTEVCYRPRAGEKEWIELTNVSDKPVDIKGWLLVDGHRLELVLTQDSAVVPPGGVVMVIFDGGGEKPQFDEEGVLLIHSPGEVKGNVLGDKGGHLALYASGKNGIGVGAMRSYTAWGRSPGRVIADAIASGRWTGIADVPQGTRERVKGMGKWIEDGGTIGFVGTFEKGKGILKDSWQVFAPDESSPSKADTFGQKRKPVLHLPGNGGGTGDDGRVTLSCVRMEKGVRYHFQICEDKECGELFEEASDLSSPYYGIDRPIPRGAEVYWRVRVTYPDGSVSSWSELRTLINYN